VFSCPQPSGLVGLAIFAVSCCLGWEGVDILQLSEKAITHGFRNIRLEGMKL
jgi:hypothetical protein